MTSSIQVHIRRTITNDAPRSAQLEKEYPPVDPVWNIQRPIQPQRCQVMCRDSLRFTCPLQHEELGEDSNCFKPDGKGPQDLREGELVVEDECEDDARCGKVFDFEGINRGVVGWSGEGYESVYELY